MDVESQEFSQKEPSIQDLVKNKPCCIDVEFTMPTNFMFCEKIETIALHSHEYIAFARNHNNQFMIDFLDYDNLIWDKKLLISIDIRANNFIAFLGEPSIIYFVILDPITTLIKFDEKTWTIQKYTIFDHSSISSFINNQYIYFLRKSSIYCINLQSIFEIMPFSDNTENNDISPKINDTIEKNTTQENKNSSRNSNSSDDNENLTDFQVIEYPNGISFLNQKKVFATQQFSHYNLIYRNDEDYPLLIFDTLTHSFCFENVLRKASSYFKRKPSSLNPLNNAKFMPNPEIKNCLFLFHDFESNQNSMIPFHDPLIIKECKNENKKSLIIIAISVKRISPIIGMFSLPGEGFNFISVTSNNYYQFYKSCGILSFINHSKNVLNSFSKQKTPEKQEIKDQNQGSIKEEVGSSNLKLIDRYKILKNRLETPNIPPSNSNNKLLFDQFKNSISRLSKILTNENKPEEDTVSSNDQKNQISLTKDDLICNQLKSKRIQSNNEPMSNGKQPKIQAVMHFLNLGPLPEVDLPYIEINQEPEYHMIITIPKIPHHLFFKNVEVIVTCIEKNDILSFFLRPANCGTPQKIEVKCNPDSGYKVKLRISNGHQSSYSDTIEFTTPNPGIPPKVGDFTGTYVSDGVYIFRWNAVSSLYNVKCYILEGSMEIPTPNENNIEPIELENINQEEDEDFHQNTNDDILEDNFEFIIELSNDIENNNICGAKLRITPPFNQFRIRALNSLGIGKPSDPCIISKTNNKPEKKDHKNSPRINKDQIQYLSEFYESNKTPSFIERNRIADFLSLPYQTVNSWFARKRHADKVNSKQKPMDINLDLFFE